MAEEDQVLTVAEVTQLRRLVDQKSEAEVALLLKIDRRTLARLLARLPSSGHIVREARSSLPKVRA